MSSRDPRGAPAAQSEEALTAKITAFENEFKSILYVRSATRREHALPETAAVIPLDKPFAVAPSQALVFVHSKDTLELHSVAPSTCVRTVAHQQDCQQLLCTHTALYCTAGTTLAVYRNGHYAQHEKLVPAAPTALVALWGAGGEGVGLQLPEHLFVFNLDMQLVAQHKAQCSATGRDVLVMGDENVLRIAVKGAVVAEVVLPERLTALCVDPLFGAVYCGAHNGVIYAVSLAGEALRSWEYHAGAVRFLRMSGCGRFLYSAEAQMVCVWDVAYGVVVGRSEFADAIEGMEVVWAGERKPVEMPGFIPQ